MASFNPDISFTNSSPHKVEKALTYGGASAFAISVIALTILGVAYPSMVTVSFSILGPITAINFVVFVVGMVLLRAKQKEDLQDLHTDFQASEYLHSSTESTQETSLEESQDVNLDYMRKLHHDLTPVLDSAEKLLLSFVANYYISENKNLNLEKIRQVKEASSLLKSFVRELSTDHRQLMRIATSIFAISLVDREMMKHYMILNDDEKFLENLPMILKLPSSVDQEYRGQLVCAKEVMQALSNRDLAKNPTTRHLIQKIKASFPSMDKAAKLYSSIPNTKENSKDVIKAYRLYLKKAKNYNTAMMEFFDHLFMHSNLEESKIREWSDRTVPAYLDTIQKKIFEHALPLVLEGISLGFEDNGFLNYKTVKAGMYGATSLVGRNTAVYPAVNRTLKFLPLEERYRNTLLTAVQTLLPAIADPLYSGTCDKNHPFCIKLTKIVRSKDFEAPKFESEQDISWSDTLKICKVFLDNLTNKLTEVA